MGRRDLPDCRQAGQGRPSCTKTLERGEFYAQGAMGPPDEWLLIAGALTFPRWEGLCLVAPARPCNGKEMDHECTESGCVRPRAAEGSPDSRAAHRGHELRVVRAACGDGAGQGARGGVGEREPGHRAGHGDAGRAAGGAAAGAGGAEDGLRRAREHRGAAGGRDELRFVRGPGGAGAEGGAGCAFGQREPGHGTGDGERAGAGGGAAGGGREGRVSGTRGGRR